MSTRLADTKTTYLDLGDLGEEVEATVLFEYYTTARQTEDDYNELAILCVKVNLDGFTIDIKDKLSKNKIKEIEEECWEHVNDN